MKLRHISTATKLRPHGRKRRASSLVMTQPQGPLAIIPGGPKMMKSLAFVPFRSHQSCDPIEAHSGQTGPQRPGARKSPRNLLLLQQLERGRFPQPSKLRPH